VATSAEAEYAQTPRELRASLMRRLAAIVCVAVIVHASESAHADPTSADPADPAEEVTWDPKWRRYSWYNAAFTLALGGGALAIAQSDHQKEGHRGGVLFDESVRDGLLAPSRRGRDVARQLGDTTFQFALVYPYLVDVVAVTWIGNGAPDVALQMALINLQSQGFAAVIGLSTAHFIGRARPSVEDCERNPGFERHCSDQDQNASFMSGHTATVATTAGLACAHNSKLNLYGDTPIGLLECVFGIAAAAGTGVSRIVADRHWATDVQAGATLGFVSGYVLPMLLHYGWTDSGPPLRGDVTADGMRLVPIPFARNGGGGLGVGGVF